MSSTQLTGRSVALGVIFTLLISPGLPRATWSVEPNDLTPEDHWTGDFPDRAMSSTRALAEYENKLILAGSFTQIDGHEYNYIAAWNGAQWAPLGDGLNGPVNALMIHDGRLVAAGEFTRAGSSSASRVAMWDGRIWTPLGEGIQGDTEARIHALATFEGMLVVGGRFTRAGSSAARNVAAWEGESWQPLGTGISGPVFAATEFQSKLVVGGDFLEAGGKNARHLAAWTGTEWEPLGYGVCNPDPCTQGLSSGCTSERLPSKQALDPQDVGPPDDDFRPPCVYSLLNDEDQLLVGGVFTRAGTGYARGVAVWDSVAWSSLGSLSSEWRSEPSCGGRYASMVKSLAVVRGKIIAAGDFVATDQSKKSNDVSNLASWNGTSWQPLGGGLNGYGEIPALIEHKGDLIVAGQFDRAGETPVGSVARWDGFRWYAMGEILGSGGVEGLVSTLVRFRGDLIAGNRLTRAGGTLVRRLARFDGKAWYPLVSSIDGNVLDMVVFRDALYAAGDFTEIDGTGVENIARWDGNSWEPVGPGLNAAVLDLEVHKDRLIAGGYFTLSGEVPVSRIAAWNGVRWSTIRGGQRVPSPRGGPVTALCSNGSVLVAGGYFKDIEEVPAYEAAQWDGEHWESLDFDEGTVIHLNSMASYEGQLFAGGDFSRRDSTSKSLWYQVARWDGKSWIPMMNFNSGEHFRVIDLGVYRRTLVAAGRFSLPDVPYATGIARWNGISWMPLGTGLSEDYPACWTLLVEGDELLVGGRFRRAGNLVSVGIARWSPPGDLSEEPLWMRASWIGDRALVRWQVQGTRNVTRFHLYRKIYRRESIRLTDEPLGGLSDYEFFDRGVPADGAEYWLAEIGPLGELVWHGPAALPPHPIGITLRSAPNPFSSQTQIAYSISARAQVKVSVFDLQGREVAVLVDKEQDAGEYATKWDGRGYVGAASGVYFLKIQAGQIARTEKLILVK